LLIIFAPRFADGQSLEASLQSALAATTASVTTVESSASALVLHLVLRAGCLAPLRFKVSASRSCCRSDGSGGGGRSEARVVVAAAGCTVRQLKDELVRLGCSGGRPAQRLRLALSGKSQVGVELGGKAAAGHQGAQPRSLSENTALLGEYAGTTATPDIPLFVLSAPAAVEDFANEVLVEVALPNSLRRVALHVSPSASLLSVKV
jgi:hypothetical protein